jgi:hypothetical protein
VRSKATKIFCGCRKVEDFIEIFLSFTQTLQGLTTVSPLARKQSREKKENLNIKEGEREKKANQIETKSP